MAKAAEELARLKIDKRRIKSFNQAKGDRQKTMEEYQELAYGIVVAKTHQLKRKEKEEEAEYARAEKQEKEQIKQINEAKAKMMKQRGRKDEIMAQIEALTRDAGETREQMKMLDQANSFIDQQDMQDIQKQLQEAHRYVEHLEVKRKQLAE